jgi:hypothetical protein
MTDLDLIRQYARTARKIAQRMRLVDLRPDCNIPADELLTIRRARYSQWLAEVVDLVPGAVAAQAVPDLEAIMRAFDAGADTLTRLHDPERADETITHWQERSERQMTAARWTPEPETVPEPLPAPDLPDWISSDQARALLPTHGGVVVDHLGGAYTFQPATPGRWWRREVKQARFADAERLGIDPNEYLRTLP